MLFDRLLTLVFIIAIVIVFVMNQNPSFIPIPSNTIQLSEQEWNSNVIHYNNIKINQNITKPINALSDENEQQTNYLQPRKEIIIPNRNEYNNLLQNKKKRQGRLLGNNGINNEEVFMSKINK